MQTAMYIVHFGYIRHAESHYPSAGDSLSKREKGALERKIVFRRVFGDRNFLNVYIILV